MTTINITHDGKSYAVPMQKLTPANKIKAEKIFSKSKSELRQKLDFKSDDFRDKMLQYLSYDTLMKIQQQPESDEVKTLLLSVVQQIEQEQEFLLWIDVVKELIDTELLPKEVQSECKKVSFWMEQELEQIKKGYEFFRRSS